MTNDTKKILIVEDEPDLLSSLARSLREEGYAVDTATNGEDGLFNARTIDYDAVVLDVMLSAFDRPVSLAAARSGTVGASGRTVSITTDSTADAPSGMECSDWSSGA